MASGASPFGPVELPEAAKTALVAVARSHRPDRYNQCMACRKACPCPNRLDAVHQLIFAGVPRTEWDG